MQAESIASWQHKHVFGQDKISQGERKTLIVIIITTMMMTWEIGAGILSGSMALLADGIHMGSHAVGLGITVTAYFFARKKAADSRFCFGTGKVNALAGYTSALILAFFALSMAWGSIQRLLRPVDIAFNQALWVAMIGLVVNGVSVWILKENPRRIGRENHVHIHVETAHSHADHNLRAAYLHVLADAFTSLTAIAALLSGKFFGLIWMDPIMGVIGAALVARWSYTLLKNSSDVLLDKHGPEEIKNDVYHAIQNQDGDRISDFHLWEIGPNIFSAALSIVTERPKPPEHYKDLIPENLGIVHTTIEVHSCNG